MSEYFLLKYVSQSAENLPPKKTLVDIISYSAPSINVHSWPFVKHAKTFMSLKKPKIQQTLTQAQNQSLVLLGMEVVSKYKYLDNSGSDFKCPKAH
jgi:hypothetical protein